MKQSVLDYIRNVSKGRARHALELIKYNISVENSMKYMFGSAIVCDDSELAKKLAFDPYVKMKTVTLDGDIYQPTGVLEGGHSGSMPEAGILKRVREI